MAYQVVALFLGGDSDGAEHLAVCYVVLTMYIARKQELSMSLSQSLAQRQGEQEAEDGTCHHDDA